jgi:DNA-binding LacI/PurR family transcriptional regulator
MATKLDRVTSLDVARKAGVSRSTVSRVLNGVASDLVSKETQGRVLKVAADLGYFPNAAAQQLRMGRSGALGLILPSPVYYLTSNYAFGQFLTGIAEVTEAAGFSLLLCPGNSSGQAARFLQNGQVDGALVLHPHKNDPMFNGLGHLGSPVVFMNQVAPDLGASWVDLDNQGGVRKAIDHLISKGHRRIGLIVGRAGFVVTEARHEGYCQGLLAGGLALDSSLVVFVPDPRLPPQGADGMLRLLALPDPPTAVLCLPDQLAMGAMTVAKEAGLRIPQDVAIVGFDDDPAAAYQNPLLTTVRGDFRGKARVAARMLIDFIEGKLEPPATILLPTELVIRQSS